MTAPERAMRVIGLTGGIATGKSTVARLLSGLGAQVVDADDLARQALAPGSPGLREVATRFPGVVVEGVLDRASLGQRVFGNDVERAALNAIVHPIVRALFAERQEALRASGEKVLIYDVPLLFETGLAPGMDGIIVVHAPLAVQRERLMKRNGLSAEEAEARIRSQAPLEEKVRQATWTIDNAGDLKTTEAQVRVTWESILAQG